MIHADEMPAAAFNPIDGCTVVAIQAYAPPAEMAAAVALWAWSALVVCIAFYLLSRVVLGWLDRAGAWRAGYRAHRKVRERAGVVPLYPSGSDISRHIGVIEEKP